MVEWEKRVSTCLYIDKEILESAKLVGLNVSSVSENALVEVIERLREPKRETGFNIRNNLEGRGRDLNSGARLHRPIGYQATSPRPLFMLFYLISVTFTRVMLFSFAEEFAAVAVFSSDILEANFD